MECPAELQELLRVLYDLSSSESAVLMYLCDSDGTPAEIAEDLDRDRSTVQRYLSKLRSAGLVQREVQNTAGKRGRSYRYSVPDKDIMKDRIRDRLEEWRQQRLDALDDI